MYTTRLFLKKFILGLKFGLKLPINTIGKSKSAHQKELKKKQGCGRHTRRTKQTELPTPVEDASKTGCPGLQLKRIISWRHVQDVRVAWREEESDCAPWRNARRPLSMGRGGCSGG